jgi:hypothetical protein
MTQYGVSTVQIQMFVPFAIAGPRDFPVRSDRVCSGQSAGYRAHTVADESARSGLRLDSSI